MALSDVQFQKPTPLVAGSLSACDCISGCKRSATSLAAACLLAAMLLVTGGHALTLSNCMWSLNAFLCKLP